MGLDNMFYLKSKSNPKLETEMGYFRKYFELDDYIMEKGRGQNFDYKRIVPLDLLKCLYQIIYPIYIDLSSLSKEDIERYDEEGYPEEICEKFSRNPFNPGHSSSAFAGWKLLELYKATVDMLEFFRCNEKIVEKDGYYIEFISSW